jgi:hypothetical protein
LEVDYDIKERKSQAVMDTRNRWNLVF